MPVSLVRMPSLDLIKGFVAVGRRMSVSDAADDLCVTQSAISKQLRTLEESLGMRLLQRGHRKVSFTPEGDRLFRVADKFVSQLQSVLGTFGECSRRPVTITASMGVSGLWLLPQLGDFQEQYPGIDLRVEANNRVLDLPSENIDLAIRYCSEPSAPRGAIKLFGERIVPVCSPSLTRKPLSSLHALKQLVLLEYDDRRPWLQWAEWLSPKGWLPSNAKGILRFNHYDQAIYAAVAGQGIALGRVELIAPMIEDGRLVPLVQEGDEFHSHYGYWLVQTEQHPRADVECVIDWLIASAESSKIAGSGSRHSPAPGIKDV